jgi:hypothetical protein
MDSIGWSGDDENTIVGRPTPVEVLAAMPDSRQAGGNELLGRRGSRPIESEDVGLGQGARAVPILIHRKSVHPAVALRDNQRAVIRRSPAIEVVAASVNRDPGFRPEEYDRDNGCYRDQERGGPKALESRVPGF